MSSEISAPKPQGRAIIQYIPEDVSPVTAAQLQAVFDQTVRECGAPLEKERASIFKDGFRRASNVPVFSDAAARAVPVWILDFATFPQAVQFIARVKGLLDHVHKIPGLGSDELVIEVGLPWENDPAP